MPCGIVLNGVRVQMAIQRAEHAGAPLNGSLQNRVIIGVRGNHVGRVMMDGDDFGYVMKRLDKLLALLGRESMKCANWR
jgi:hypothetical protein